MPNLFGRIKDVVQKLKSVADQPVPAPPDTEAVSFEAVVEEFQHPTLRPEDFNYVGLAEMAATIRKAGMTRFLVYMLYNNKFRYVEPYSFRRGKKGLLFFGHDIQANDIRSFYLLKISQLKMTDIPFSPRWVIEL